MIETIIKIFLSAIVGWFVGRERKKRDKSGGSRTMAIVCMASCLIALMALELKDLASINYDIGRLPSYAIASIGFLGSGICVQNKGNVEGLTTASCLWAVVPLGLCIGFGFYTMGLFSAGLIYLILESKFWLYDK